MLIPMVLLTGLTLGQTPARQTPFQSPYPLEDMRGTQAVLETSEGTIVIDLLAEVAPNHVGLFMKLAREGAYAGTTFHWAVPYGAIQGGDPISRDPAKRAASEPSPASRFRGGSTARGRSSSSSSPINRRSTDGRRSSGASATGWKSPSGFPHSPPMPTVASSLAW
jgi:hypothetical protein